MSLSDLNPTPPLVPNPNPSLDTILHPLDVEEQLDIEDCLGGAIESDIDGNPTGTADLGGDETATVENGVLSVDPDFKKVGGSIAWKHMDPVKLPSGLTKIKCRHCGILMSVSPSGTTTHLVRHLVKSCPHSQKNFPKEHAALKDANSKLVQSQLHGVVLSEGESSVSTFVFNFERVKLLAAHMVLAHEYPFSIFEHKVFNEFLRAYTPYYKKISRYMVRKQCFIIYETEKERLKVMLGRVSRVSLTTDCWWSGVQRIGFMVITVHYIDQNWKLQKRVLSFVNVPPPHNGAALAREVHRVAHEYGISDKVASVTVDNATANDLCISILKKDYDMLSQLVLDGKLFHVRCCAHIINLLVQDGLKEINHVIDMVREGVKYLFGSENRLKSFNEYRINAKLPGNKLVLDNNTRWNSTYVMLSTAYKFRQCFSKFAEDDESFERYCPSDVEWEEVNEVCEFLEVFLDVTNLVSATNYPTVNLFLLELSRIHELINAQINPLSKKHMNRMAIKMATKYDKYWEECDLLITFGSILDPRYKKGMLEFAYTSMYPDDSKTRIDFVMSKFKELFEEYVKIYGNVKGKGPESYSSYLKPVPATSVGKRKFDEYMATITSKGKDKSDLDLYFEERCHPNDGVFDALDWWKINAAKYVVLSKMAKDILSIPITTVASESTFSAGGRVIDKKRASMRKDTIEVLLCGGDWIKEAYGIRSYNEVNGDPPEIEHENEYDMLDPNAITTPVESVDGAAVAVSTQAQKTSAAAVAISTQAQRSAKKAPPTTSTSKKGPRSSKPPTTKSQKGQKITRRT